MKVLAGLLLGLTLSAAAHAGAQLEEPLADKVRTALAASVADTAPPPTPCTTNWRAWGWTWCSTIVASVRARCSPTGS